MADTTKSRIKYTVIALLMSCIVTQFTLLTYVLMHAEERMQFSTIVLSAMCIFCIAALALLGEHIYHKW